MGKRKIYKGRQAGKVKRQERKCTGRKEKIKRQARKVSKDGKERQKCRQGKLQRQARKGEKIGKERHKGGQGKA